MSLIEKLHWRVQGGGLADLKRMSVVNPAILMLDRLLIHFPAQFAEMRIKARDRGALLPVDGSAQCSVGLELSDCASHGLMECQRVLIIQDQL